MKKVLIAAIILVGFSAASFAQTTPAPKKNETSKTTTQASTAGTKGKWKHKGNKDASKNAGVTHLKKEGTTDTKKHS